MRFLADMGVSIRVVEWLRSEGHEAVHLREEGLQTLPDQAIFEKAGKESRTLLAFDLDFGEIIALSHERLISVILFRLRNTRTPFVIDRLRKVIDESEKALKEGVIVTVEDSRHRVRYLPLGK